MTCNQGPAFMRKSRSQPRSGQEKFGNRQEKTVAVGQINYFKIIVDKCDKIL